MSKNPPARQTIDQLIDQTQPKYFLKKQRIFSIIFEWSEMIKLEHTVFALPFALAGLVLAQHRLPELKIFFWTICAFVGARSAAMTLNRLIDAQIDVLNPRTKSRAIPSGRIKKQEALLAVILAFSLMVLAASHLPPLCLWLSPIAVFWLSFYSYTKRFTWLCHLVLGIALGGAALGGWIAAGGQLDIASPWILAIAISSWVAGFDIIYALQDLEFDQRQNLHSIPAAFGIEQALTFSSILHIITVACLALLGGTMALGPIYWTGVIFVAIMLIYEHKLVLPSDLSKINAAFFTTNGIVSVTIFIAILLDKILFQPKF